MEQCCNRLDKGTQGNNVVLGFILVEVVCIQFGPNVFALGGWGKGARKRRLDLPRRTLRNVSLGLELTN